MYAKLVFRNAKRSVKDYLVYIVTMTICVTLFYAFLSISSSYYSPDIGSEYDFIMFLTAADEETDIIMGLDIGGDDYITKPFKLAIFLSRLNALLRRSENFNTEVTELTSNDISIRLLKGEVYKQGKLLELTASEYKLLCFFMENPDQVLSAEQILGKLWDCNENYIDNNSLTVYIRRLRTKIEDNPGEPKRIVTVRGMGYKWNTVD